MKIYVLVSQDKDGEPTLDMPVTFGRSIRAYTSKARAKVYARKFKSYVIEVKLTDGKIVHEG